MTVTLPAVGSLNWGDALNAAITGLSATIDAHTAVIATQPASASDTTDLLAQTTTTFAPGSPVCGVPFTAPGNGKIYATVSAHMETNTAGEGCYMAYEIRTGSTIGSGTVFTTATTDNGVGVLGFTAAARINASRRKLITGLTPGGAYNIRTMHLCTGGNFDVFYREILVEPAKST
jgi:hypothetical protein